MDIKKEIDSIKIIDQHCHVMDPFYWQDAIGAAPPFPPHVHGLDIPTSATHVSKAMKLIGMFQALYGFPYSEVTDENKAELQAMYEKSKTNEVELYHKVMDLAGVEMAGATGITAKMNCWRAAIGAALRWPSSVTFAPLRFPPSAPAPTASR